MFAPCRIQESPRPLAGAPFNHLDKDRRWMMVALPGRSSCTRSCARFRVTHDKSMPVAGWRDARTVVDVANRIGHTRRPFRHRVSSSSTRPEKTAQEGVFSMCLCGSITVQSRTSAFTHPSCRLARREVPFLTGQKGDGKSRRAVRVAADGSAPGPRIETRFAQTPIRDAGPKVIPLRCPSAAQRRPGRRTAKGPGKESAQEKRKQANGTALFCSTSKRASIGRRSQPATGIVSC